MNLRMAGAGPGELRKILVVDDAPTVRLVLSHVVDTLGYAVTQADNGAAGLECAKRDHFDLIIADIAMPSSDGLTMIKEIRKLRGYDKTPIFVLTADSGRQTRTQGEACGATAWIVKPFKTDSLSKAIAQFLAPR